MTSVIAYTCVWCCQGQHYRVLARFDQCNHLPMWEVESISSIHWQYPVALSHSSGLQQSGQLVTTHSVHTVTILTSAAPPPSTLDTTTGRDCLTESPSPPSPHSTSTVRGRDHLLSAESWGRGPRDWNKSSTFTEDGFGGWEQTSTADAVRVAWHDVWRCLVTTS